MTTGMTDPESISETMLNMHRDSTLSDWHRRQCHRAFKEIERLNQEIKQLLDERAKAGDAQFGAFMAGLGPSPWER